MVLFCRTSRGTKAVNETGRNYTTERNTVAAISIQTVQFDQVRLSVIKEGTLFPNDFPNVCYSSYLRSGVAGFWHWQISLKLL